MKKVIGLLFIVILSITMTNCSSPKKEPSYDYDKQKRDARDAADKAFDEIKQQY